MVLWTYKNIWFHVIGRDSMKLQPAYDSHSFSMRLRVLKLPLETFRTRILILSEELHEESDVEKNCFRVIIRTRQSSRTSRNHRLKLRSKLEAIFTRFPDDLARLGPRGSSNGPQSQRVCLLSEYDALAARHINWGWSESERWANARDARTKRTRKGGRGRRERRDVEEPEPRHVARLFPCLLSTDTRRLRMDPRLKTVPSCRCSWSIPRSFSWSWPTWLDRRAHPRDVRRII